MRDAFTMIRSLPKQTRIFTLLTLLRHALAYEPGTGSAVAGNLSAAAPWGIPPDLFKSDTSNPDDSAAFNMTGYDITSTAPSPQAAPGWKLTARVKDDVALTDATNPSTQVFQATTLYVEAPDSMALDSSWRICGVVYPGVASAPSANTTVDGSCRNVLSSGCMQALSVTPTSGGSGMDDSGACTTLALPERCSGDFPAGTGNVSAVAINQTVLDDKRFYAFGSPPTSSGNTTAQDEARQNVWPVVMIFGHLSSDGQRSSTNAAVQCVRAVNGTVDDDLPGSAAARLGLGSSVLAALGAGLVTGWVLMV